VGEEVNRHSGDLVDNLVANTVTEVAPIVFTWYVFMQASELPVAPPFVAVMQVATKLSIIDVLIHFGGHFEHEEAGRIIAMCASGAVIGGTQGAGETEVYSGADEPAEAAVDMAFRSERNGLRAKLIVREPAAWRFGKRRGEGLSVLLIETLSMGNEGIEIKGHELLGGKR
jgi:hypothetical protein